MSYSLTLTTAGLDALVDAQAGATEPIQVTEVGLTAAVITPAPTLTALPAEIKRIGSISGTSVSETIIHMTAQDASEDSYEVRAFGLYLADGTLFAVYGQADILVSKTSRLQLQIAFDIAFQDGIAGDIEFGNATFLIPPASETIKGVAEIATQAETDTGTDDERIVTPLKLAVRLAAEAALWLAGDNALGALITALTGRTITGSGLATGGGDLSNNRQINVASATAAELQAATESAKAVTPAAFGGLTRVRGAASYEVLPGGTLIQHGRNRVTISAQQSVTLTFPVAFADTNYDLQVLAVIPSTGDFDNYFQEIEGTRTTTGVQLFAQDPSDSPSSSTLSGYNWRAEGRI